MLVVEGLLELDANPVRRGQRRIHFRSGGELDVATACREHCARTGGTADHGTLRRTLASADDAVVSASTNAIGVANRSAGSTASARDSAW